MAQRKAESDFGLQGWIDTLGLKLIFLIYSAPLIDPFERATQLVKVCINSYIVEKNKQRIKIINCFEFEIKAKLPRVGKNVPFFSLEQ